MRLDALKIDSVVEEGGKDVGNRRSGSGPLIASWGSVA